MDFDQFPKKYLLGELGNGQDKPRNNSRKKLYDNLKLCIKDKESEEERDELAKKIEKIEELLNDKYKGGYIYRVLEIIHYIKENNDFREKIYNGEITPEQLVNMENFEMSNKKEQEERKLMIKKNNEASRSDWAQTHRKVTEGLYTCFKCKGKKTYQYEMQTRSADEPMTIFITCANCENTWKIG